MKRAHALLVARVAFLLLTLGFAWWGFRGRWGDIWDAALATGPMRLGGAVLLALTGLGLTGLLWRRLLASLGTPVSVSAAAEVFFVGQLGKYVPGSVWSFAVQAHLGRRHDVPARSSVGASALFLLIHTFSGVVVGGVLAASGVETRQPWWLWLLVAAGGALLLAPPMLRWLGDRVAGGQVRTDFGVRELAFALTLMGAVWVSYGLSLWLLVPYGEVSPLLAIATFALAHAAGVLLVFAPAGLGAREAVAIGMLSPAIGVPAAAAVALLSRVAHSVADFAIAAAAHLGSLAQDRQKVAGADSL